MSFKKLGWSHSSRYSQFLFLQNWDSRPVHVFSGPVTLRWYESGLAWEMLIQGKTENDTVH